MDITEFARMGGKARAAALTPEVRKQIARKAIAKRWGRPVPILASKYEDANGKHIEENDLDRCSRCNQPRYKHRKYSTVACAIFQR